MHRSSEKKEVLQIIDVSPEKSENNTEMDRLPQAGRSNNTTLNAFQFLMSSRNKVIGSNSPGKELLEKEHIPGADREKLAVRKTLLQSWADSKKERKRKLDDEEIDTCIKVKLERRKKRFKTLLNGENINEKCAKIIDSPLSLTKSKTRQMSLKKFGLTSADSTVCVSDVMLIENENESNDKSLNEITEDKNLLNVLSETKTKEKFCKSLSSGNEFEGEKKDSQSSKKKNHKHKHKNKLSNDSIINSPNGKSLRQWKMRIKLLDDEKLNINDDNVETTNSEQIIERVIDIENEDISVSKDCEKQKYDGNIIEVDTNNHENGCFKSKKKLKSKTNENQTKFKKRISSNKCYEPNNIASLQENKFKRVLRDRTSIHKIKVYTFEDLSSNESSNESSNDRVNKKKPLKVAPIFTKTIPKPQVDPELMEAKRKFLLSEIPDMIKKTSENKGSRIIPEFDVFPKISHITQISPEELLFYLSNVDLPMRTDDMFEYTYEDLKCKSLINISTVDKSSFNKSKPIQNVRTIIRNLKFNNPDYPVHRSFRLLQQKTGKGKKTSENVTSGKHDNARKETNSRKESQSSEHTWIEKYKPNSSEEFIGNFQAVSYLKKWLESWHEAFKNRKKKFETGLISSDSESDFILSDSESLLGSSSLPSTVILTGPCGSGKSSSVYAICNELGLDVIELNASSRRSGKQVLQEIQEATQSHQVRKIKESTLWITAKKKLKPKNENKEHSARKMCVVLIEDVDIVFQQDDGLINAICEISSATKRPIILTTSNVKSIHSQKFMNDFKNIQFYSLTAKDMATWLQILCLIEGYFVDISSIGEFLEYNNGDMRKTLMGMQFWIQSGGQINKNNNLLDTLFQIDGPYQDNEDVCLKQRDDDTSNISLKEQEGIIENFRTHSNLLSDFEIFHLDRFFDVPLNFDLVKIWWNIPRFLNIESENGNVFNPRKKSKRNRIKLKMISDMFDSLAWCDIAYRKALFKCDIPVCFKRWNNCLYDSLELTEVSDEYSSNTQLFCEWNHYLVNGNLNRCKERFAQPVSKCQRLLNMALPRVEHKRMLAKSYEYEEELMTPVPLFCHSDRKSVCLDYLPSLRNIARSEKNRAQNNIKRNNRFYNYLQSLNIKCNNSVLSVATDTLIVNR
ncbi:hypothetical protein WA026_015394 [Henosepilachna vigintioctopunctata]|uniref:ATPase AAA-type core domain-containing protein n=1 Tax=Henosepilachna vigintioctopunctata TaxID=420089 RepID=A0AAW1UMM9_9CUCU